MQMKIKQKSTIFEMLNNAMYLDSYKYYIFLWQSLSLLVQSKILEKALKLHSTSPVLLSPLSDWVFGPGIRDLT